MGYQVNQKGLGPCTKATYNDFKHSRLSRLSPVDWQNEHHRRSIAASLVMGAYVLEDDRQEKRVGYRALAPPWWKFFNFELQKLLIDDADSSRSADSSIFGAVFEFKPKSNNYYPIGAPRYVIAFRGTVLKKDTIVRDIVLDINIFIGNLQHRSHFRKAIQAIEQLVSASGASNIWLAGNSLGSSIAMEAGKNMATMVNFLETILNPPFVAFPIESIESRKLKRGIHFAGRLLAHAMKDKQERQPHEHLYKDLTPWVPNLFLHPYDIICSGFIEYFELRENMQSSGRTETFVTPNLLKGLLVNAVGTEYFSEESHLIPSARVTTSCSPDVHMLCQWFPDDSVLGPKLYRYK
ncbi:hypothetical protein MKX03_013758 [Papaver bracteatum]|nr:hypothetical protein MKX03_013758 [Papaver bracteatum]